MLLFIVIVFLFQCCSTVAPPGVYIEGGSGSCQVPDYYTVQEGIDAASHGDTIWVCCGTHDTPDDIDVNKKLTIKGVSECKPDIVYTHGCANMNLRGHDIHIENLRFTKTGEETGCLIASQYAISSPMTCVYKVGGLKIIDCVFEHLDNGILLRTSKNVLVKHSKFSKIVHHAIHLSHASTGPSHVKFANNEFELLGGNAVHVMPIALCEDCDVVKGQVMIEDNRCTTTRANFVYWDHWCGSTDNCKVDILKIKGNTVGHIAGICVLFNDPTCQFPFTFLKDKLEIEYNVFHHATAGVFVDYQNSTEGAVPDEKTIRVKKNEFCYLSGLPGVFIGHEPHVLGRRLLSL